MVGCPGLGGGGGGGGGGRWICDTQVMMIHSLERVIVTRPQLTRWQYRGQTQNPVEFLAGTRELSGLSK